MFTVPVNPFTGVSVMVVDAAAPPGAIVSEDGVAVMVTEGAFDDAGPVIDTVTVAELVFDPLVPVTVIG